MKDRHPQSKHRLFLALAVAFLVPTSARAAITWNWGFSGIQGFFVTDGDLISGSAPAMTYSVTDFGVTDNGGYSIPTGSILTAEWNEGAQPGTGFVWDGSQATQYFRGANLGSPFTNGTNYYSNTSQRMLFFPGSYGVTDADGFTQIASGSSSNLTAVPEPGVFPVLSLAGLAFAFRRRRAA